jgi:hypothetical protein
MLINNIIDNCIYILFFALKLVRLEFKELQS